MKFDVNIKRLLAIIVIIIIIGCVNACISTGQDPEKDEEMIEVIAEGPPEYVRTKITYIKTNYNEGDFKMVHEASASDIYIHENDHWGVKKAAGDLQNDINKVTAIKPRIKNKPETLNSHAIIIGTIGKNPFIDTLIDAGKIDVTDIQGKWESFVIQVIDTPINGVEKALVIAGSDKRGTIYGIYDVSQSIGISPWYYWADIPPKKQTTLAVKPGVYKQGEPSVKYRGIFLNDEQPCLTGWVYHTFGDYTHQFYEKVFELLLRLKANYLWPAMWNSAFNEDDPLNPELADKYGIVMGTSHHEPMMCAHKEWKINGTGEWNYATNADTLFRFWDKGMKRNSQYESLVTVGMRGDGDEPMPGDTMEEKIDLLQKIISDQREIIANRVNPDVAQVPQIWTIYKEVQDFYDFGMRVPDDITHLWCDDNFGNLRRVPTAEERERPGGAGIYYHFDYVGGPISYKWINTIPITKIWEQMLLVYEYGADRVWIVNVGDLKPMEFPISFFLSFAWNVNQWNKDNLYHFAIEWAEEQFGTDYAADIADILMKYTKYNGRRKPAVITTKTFHITHYREAEKVLEEWQAVVTEAERIYKEIPDSYKDAFFQLVLYPVRASKHVMGMHYYAALNNLYYEQGRGMTNMYADLTRKIFSDEEKDTYYYNNQLKEGKWKHMMDQPHIGAKVWDGPKKNTMPGVSERMLTKESDMGIALEESTKTWPGPEECRLPEFSSFVKNSYYIEIFNKGVLPFTFTAIPEKPWIRVSLEQGIVIKQKRIWVTIDWDKAPKGKKIKGDIIITGTGSEVTIKVKAFNPRSPKIKDITGFVENPGYVSIEAEHFTRKTEVRGVSWEKIYDYGRTQSSMAIFPVTASSADPPGDAPCLEYDVYFFHKGETEITTYTAPSCNINPEHGLRYGISIDDQPPVIVDTFRIDQDGFYTDKEWSRAVMDNICQEKTTHSIRSKGKHTLKIWMVDPGLVIQKIVINTGNLKKSYLGPPESYFRGKKRMPEPGGVSFDPHTIPGKIEAEHYNDGKNGEGYRKKIQGNTDGLYRRDDVNIRQTEEGFAVSDMEADEWLKYDVYSECTTEYIFSMNASNGSASPGVIHLECDGKDISGPIEIPSTNNRNTFTRIPVPGLSITRGKHIITLCVDSGSVDIDWIQFSTRNGKTWIEAESAKEQTEFKPFTVKSGAIASGGEYMVVENGTSTKLPKDGIAAYTFNAPGSVNIWLRLHAPTPDDDSVFLKIDDGKWQTWNSITGAERTLTWVLWRTVTGLAEDTHTLWIGRREDGVKIDKILISPDLEFKPGNHYIEAESASTRPGFPPFRVIPGKEASGGKYITREAGSAASPPGDGIAAYTFDAEGSVNVWMNLHTPSGRNDSFFIKIDNEPWRAWDTISGAEEGWTWVLWKNLDNLSSQTHTLSIAGKEGNAKLDNLLITDDLAFIPGNFANKPVPIPGKIEMEDYNIGLNGIAYYDSTPGNECGEYRDDDVDICKSETGYAIGYTVNREWLNYEVEVEAAAEYTIEVWCANGMEHSRTCHLECDGRDIIPPGGINVPPTGDWETYVPVTVTGVVIPEGRHTLRLFVDMSNVNIDYMVFTKSN
jgi:hypothetical protein